MYGKRSPWRHLETLCGADLEPTFEMTHENDKQLLCVAVSDAGRRQSHLKHLSQSWSGMVKIRTCRHWIIVACLLECRCAVFEEDSICGRVRGKRQRESSNCQSFIPLSWVFGYSMDWSMFVHILRGTWIFIGEICQDGLKWAAFPSPSKITETITMVS